MHHSQYNSFFASLIKQFSICHELHDEEVAFSHIEQVAERATLRVLNCRGLGLHYRLQHQCFGQRGGLSQKTSKFAAYT